MRDDQAPICCPRCGYDQRGLVSSWQDHCPLHSVCTECGLDIEWREVLNPMFALPKWCVEARRSVLAFPSQMLGTTIRVWLAPVFWRSLQMVHLVNRPRLAVWLAVWLAILMVTLAGSNGVAALAHWTAVTTPTGATAAMIGNADGLDVFLQAAFLPLSGRSIGTYTGGGFGAMPYLPPQQALQWISSRAIWPSTVLLAVPAFCGLAFAAMPVSRHRAKVRWLHIIRATAYAYGLACTATMAVILRQCMTLWMGFTGAASSDPVLTLIDLLSLALPPIAMLLLLAFIPALAVYWHACVKRYLRMEQAWAVALSVTIIGLLAPVSVYGALWYWLE